MPRQNKSKFQYEEYHLMDGGLSVAVSAGEFFSWVKENGGRGQSRLFVIAIQWAEFLLNIIQHALKTQFFVRLSPKSFMPELLKTWKALLDNRVITSVLRLPTYKSYPSSFCYSLRLGNIYERTDGHTDFLIANIGGSDFQDKRLALERAFAEALERFAFLIYRERDLRFCRASELPYGILDPSECVLWKRDSGTGEPMSFLEQSFGWVEGRNYSNEERIFIPAQLVFWNYHRRNGEPFIREPNTNGAAVHRSKIGAIQAALLELIERDALMNAWFAKLSPAQITLSSLPPDLRAQARIDAFDKSRLEIYLLLLPTDVGIPVVGAAIIDQSGKGPIISLGSSAAFELNAAVVKAVREALAVYVVERERKTAKMFSASVDLFPSPNQFRLLNFGGRMELWWRQEAFEMVEHLLKGERQPYAEIKSKFSAANFDILVSRIRTLNYRILYYSAEVPWIKNLGYHATKVIVPELQPLYLSERRRGCNRQRLEEWCSNLQLPLPGEINATLHPFP